MKSEDKQFIKDFGIVAILSGILIIGVFFVISLIFFYGSPFTLAWLAILSVLRLRICDEGVEISFAKIIQRYIKISISITR